MLYIISYLLYVCFLLDKFYDWGIWWRDIRQIACFLTFMIGLIAGGAKGFLRLFKCEPSCVIDLIPVDYAVNLMIAVAWHTAIQKYSYNLFIETAYELCHKHAHRVVATPFWSLHLRQAIETLRLYFVYKLSQPNHHRRIEIIFGRCCR